MSEVFEEVLEQQHRKMNVFYGSMQIKDFPSASPQTWRYCRNLYGPFGSRLMTVFPGGAVTAYDYYNWKDFKIIARLWPDRPFTNRC